MTDADVQYISDERGELTGVIIPIELWQEIVSEREAHHLLKNAAMKKRLLEAIGRSESIALDEALGQLGIE